MFIRQLQIVSENGGTTQLNEAIGRLRTLIKVETAQMLGMLVSPLTRTVVSDWRSLKGSSYFSTKDGKSQVSFTVSVDYTCTLHPTLTKDLLGEYLRIVEATEFHLSSAIAV